ncbi:hypothetical protein F4818DRAFT_431435 [Hypoxylon cercidicola]|nr:hypothetical protein F4818DRAFT_431435 [Hypoxylon cercidicola]
MTSDRPQRSRGPAQTPSPREKCQQQQQLLRETGAQFDRAILGYDGMAQALKELPENPRTTTPQLRAVLGRTATAKGDLTVLINSDIVASLSSVDRR